MLVLGHGVAVSTGVEANGPAACGLPADAVAMPWEDVANRQMGSPGQSAVRVAGNGAMGDRWLLVCGGLGSRSMR